MIEKTALPPHTSCADDGIGYGLFAQPSIEHGCLLVVWKIKSKIHLLHISFITHYNNNDDNNKTTSSRHVIKNEMYLFKHCWPSVLVCSLPEHSALSATA